MSHRFAEREMHAITQRTRRNQAALLLVQFVLMALAVEGAFRVLLSSDRISSRILTLEDDLLWRRQWLERHREKNLEVYYGFDQYDRTKGWSTQPNYHASDVWARKTVRTNARGLRGAQNFSYERSPGRARIVLLGDSFTFGDEVSDDETYAQVLRELLPDVDVINLGVHGYGHDQMLIYLNEEGGKYHPDVVLLGFIRDDMDRNVLTFRDFAKPRFVWSGSGLVLENSPVPTPQAVELWDWLRPRSYDVYRLVEKRIRNQFFVSSQREVEEITAHLLDRMTDVIRSMNAQPVFAFLPTPKELADEKLGSEHEQFLMHYCADRPATACVSLLPTFLARMRQGVTYNRQGHWSAIGHRTVAEGLRDYLVAHRYVPR